MRAAKAEAQAERGAEDAKRAAEASAAAEKRASLAEQKAEQREKEVRAAQQAAGGAAAATAATQELRRQLEEAMQAASQQAGVIDALARERRDAAATIDTLRAQIEALQLELANAAKAAAAAEGRNADTVRDLESRLREAIRLGTAEIQAIDLLRQEVAEAVARAESAKSKEVQKLSDELDDLRAKLKAAEEAAQKAGERDQSRMQAVENMQRELVVLKEQTVVGASRCEAEPADRARLFFPSVASRGLASALHPH